MDDNSSSVVARGHLACHCVLVETDSQLVLIDTGLGRLDVQNPGSRLSRFFLNIFRPDFRDDMTAFRQIQSLGYNPEDVRNILLTHLDFDHAGGLDDFPHAIVHLLQVERDYALRQKTWLDRQRFRPQQWSTRENWKVYRADSGESWFGFRVVRKLEGVPSEILMIPLIGHTYGHCGFAVRRQNDWLLHAGDAYYSEGEMNIGSPWCPRGLRFYQTMMEKDRRARLRNQERLRDLRFNHGHEVTIFSAHDVSEFERLAGRSASVPADKLLEEDYWSGRRVG